MRSTAKYLGFAVILILAGVVVSAWPQTPSPFDSSPEIQSTVDANIAFAIDLYQKLKTQHENLFFSPYSISSALAMTYAGARGQTENEMARVLHFDPAQGDVHAAFGTLTARMNALQRWNRITLLDANSLWCQKDYPFTAAFLNLVQKDYAAHARTVDFVNASEAARGDINSWVMEKTHGKISDLIAPGQLTSDTRLVLCNAIYFKGKWQTQFKPDDTRSRSFYISPTQTVSVPMMSLDADFKLAYTSDSIGLLELPYAGSDLSMVIIMPLGGPWLYREGRAQSPLTLSDLEAKLTPQNLHSWLHALDAAVPQETPILVPRFTTAQSFDLSEELKSLGMTSAFGSEANFSGMDGTANLYISEVVHKAFVEVDESGTEAAAATAVSMKTLGEVAMPFVVNHPFIFLIRDNGSGSVLFLGRVVDPTK